MGEPMNYDDYAERYRKNRWAVDWIFEPLKKRAAMLSAGQRVVEFGCGTGNYLLALREEFPSLRYFGFDLSRPMLEQARARVDEGSSASAERVGARELHLTQENAEQRFPYPDDFAHFVYCVDVLHHLKDYVKVVREIARVLAPSGTAVAVTDSPEDIAMRSLTRFFPEALTIEQRRYPNLDQLDRLARAAGLTVVPRQRVRGQIPLADDFIAKLEGRCASSLRLIDEDAHRRGMKRVREAAQRGAIWESFYTVVTYEVAEKLV